MIITGYERVNETTVSRVLVKRFYSDWGKKQVWVL